MASHPISSPGAFGSGELKNCSPFVRMVESIYIFKFYFTEYPQMYDAGVRHFFTLILLHSEWPKAHRVLAILSSVGLSVALLTY